MNGSVAVEAAVGDWLGLSGAGVLVAGAGGIGHAIIEAFEALGAAVTVVDGDPDRAGADGIVADLRDPETCRRIVAEAHARMGRLDVFIHAVGMNLRQPVLDFTDEDWRTIVDVNLNTAFWLGQAAGRIMVEQRSGRLVFLSSVSGLLAHKHHAPYAATKGGINQMMRVMATEWAPYNVTVNAIGPGYVETPLTAAYLEKPGIRAGLESLVPAGRLGTTADVANAALFLASNRASFVTGHVLYVDGGRTLV